MAVGPLRTLLVAHAQASVNRAFKEMGRQGTAAAWSLAVLLVLTLVLPLLASSVFFGWKAGATISDPMLILLPGLAVTVIPFGAGIVNGFFGDPRHLSWESYRSFPVPARTLLMAELLAGLGSLLPLLATALSVGLMVGMSIALPHLIPFHLLILFGMISSMLVVQFLAASLTSVLARWHRVTLASVFVLSTVLTLSSAWWDAASQQHAQRMLRLASCAPGVSHPVASFHDLLLENLRWIPGVAAMRGVSHASQGSWGQALALQLPSLLLLGLLVAAAGWVASRGVQPSRLDSSEGTAPQGWRFRTPTGAIARLQWVTLLTSQQGKATLVMPLLTLVIMKGLAHLLTQGQAPLVTPLTFLYLCLVSGPLQFNQFGLDGHGVKTLLLLPISPREYLQGKALGFAAFVCLQCALLVALMLVAGRVDPAQLAAGLLFAGCIFLIQNGVGQWTSAWMPRNLRWKNKAGPPLPLAVALLYLGVSLASGAVFGGLYLLLTQFAPAWLVPGMAAALAFCGLGYWRLLPLAANYLRLRQETLVQILG